MDPVIRDTDVFVTDCHSLHFSAANKYCAAFIRRGFYCAMQEEKKDFKVNPRTARYQPSGIVPLYFLQSPTQ
jgi:hypothetical protein